MTLTKPRERILVTINVPPDKRHILEKFDKLVRLERLRGGRSELTIRAWKEYIDHHWPGNPQQTFYLPSIADPHRDRAAINFLRHQAKLPITQIAKIVGRSVGYVYKACGSSGFRAVRVKAKTLRLLKERFKGFMEGRYESPKEAFEIS